MPNACIACKRNEEDGLCQKRAADDGLPMRCVGPWSQEKHYYLKRYIDIFTTGMRGKFVLNYVDLFCGPGVCCDRH